MSPSFGVESETNSASFYDVPTGFAVGTYNESIGSYDLSAPLGPVTGFFESPGPVPELTSAGELAITVGADTTFQATAVSPEPSSLVLLGTGLCGFAGAWRRRMIGCKTTVRNVRPSALLSLANDAFHSLNPQGYRPV